MSRDLSINEPTFDRLFSTSEFNFNILLSLLSSYFKSNVDGPYYARSLKMIAKELARIQTILTDEILSGYDYNALNPDYVYQNLSNNVFTDQAPDDGYTDVEFRTLCVSMIRILLTGSKSSSIREAVSILVKNNVAITEPGMDNTLNANLFIINIDMLASVIHEHTLKAIKIVVDLLKPAHTIYRINFSTSESFSSYFESSSVSVACSSYEDFRKLVRAPSYSNNLGSKSSDLIKNETHTV